MTTPTEPSRRYQLALTAAVAGITLAIGVTAATLLGWLRPAGDPTAPPSPVAATEIGPAPVVVEAPPASAREHEHEHEEDGDDD